LFRRSPKKIQYFVFVPDNDIDRGLEVAPELTTPFSHFIDGEPTDFGLFEYFGLLNHLGVQLDLQESLVIVIVVWQRLVKGHLEQVHPIPSILKVNIVCSVLFQLCLQVGIAPQKPRHFFAALTNRCIHKCFAFFSPPTKIRESRRVRILVFFAKQEEQFAMMKCDR
jgi:hypothetical protein